MDVLELLDHGTGHASGGVAHRMDPTRCIRHGCRNPSVPDSSWCQDCYQWAKGETDVDPLGERPEQSPLIVPVMPDSDDPAEWRRFREQQTSGSFAC